MELRYRRFDVAKVVGSFRLAGSGCVSRSLELTCARRLEVAHDRSYPSPYVRRFTPVACFALRHCAGRKTFRVRAEAAAKSSVTAGTHSGDQFLHLRRWWDVALCRSVVKRPAADQPYRQLPQGGVVSSHEAPRVTVPSIRVQRARHDHRVKSVQVVDISRAGHQDLITGVGECRANHARQARGAAPLGSEGDEYSGHRWRGVSGLLGIDEASALALICRSVARMMWATNGRITHQYRRNRRREPGSVVTVRHSYVSSEADSPQGKTEKFAAILPQPHSAKLLKSSGATLCHSMVGCQNFPTAPRAISRFGCCPSDTHPGKAICSPITKRGGGGVAMPDQRAGRARSHIDRVSNGVRTVSRSNSRTAAKVAGGSAATTKCSAITTSYVGIADSINIRPVAGVVTATMFARLAGCP